MSIAIKMQAFLEKASWIRRMFEEGARLKAEHEYEVYRVTQDKNYISDFDKEVKRITGEKKAD